MHTAVWLRKELILYSLLLILASVVWLGQYAERDLWNQDEARYTYVAWEMEQADSTFMPVRNGQPYAHKPPLMFWLIRASSNLTAGEFNGISGRLPTLLGAVLALAAFFKLASLWFDSGVAKSGVLVLITSSLFWGKGGMGQIDMLLLGLEMWAVYLLFSYSGAGDRWRLDLAFVFCGLAILTKGPVGLIVPLGIFIGSRLAEGSARKIPWSKLLQGTLLALLFPATWLLLVKLNGAPDSYFSELLFSQNVERFAGRFGGHVKSFYFYLPYLFRDFLPWSFLLPASFYLVWTSEDGAKKLRRIIGWVIFVVLFFSLCASKRNLYILSVYPAFSLVVAAAVPELNRLSDRWRRITLLPLFGCLVLVVLALFIAPLLYNFGVDYRYYSYFGMLVLTGLAALLTLYFWRGLNLSWIYALAVLAFAAELYFGSLFLPQLNDRKTPRLVSRDIKQTLQVDKPLLLYHMNGEIFSLYCKRRGLSVYGPENLLTAMKENRQGVVIFKMRDWNSLRNELGRFGKEHFFTMGKESFYWLAYDLTEPEDSAG